VSGSSKLKKEAIKSSAIDLPHHKGVGTNVVVANLGDKWDVWPASRSRHFAPRKMKKLPPA
jgi:hypothetical protein